MRQKPETPVRKLVGPGGAPAVPLEEAAQEIAGVLSNIGSVMSTIGPYQSVQSVTVDHAAYDKKAGGVIGKITVRLHVRDMSNGNIEDAQEAFILSREIARLAMEKAWSSTKPRIEKIIAAFDEAQREYEQRGETLETAFSQFGAGHGRALPAPEPARFGKRKPDKAGPQ